MELEPDTDIEHQIEETIEGLPKEMEELNLLLLLNGPYDKNNCILDIHSGAGGTEKGTGRTGRQKRGGL